MISSRATHCPESKHLQQSLSSAPPERVVIIGAGQAAAQAIDTLRLHGYGGSIVLVGAEPSLPYQRPPLSKELLSRRLDRNRLLIHPDRFYANHRVETLLGRPVREIDRAAQRVRLESGESLAYDALLLATGGRARRLAVPGADLAGVYELRTLADAERLNADLSAANHVAVIGGGYIGLEVAAACRKQGRDVTVFEMAGRVMQRTTCPQVSDFYHAEHARNGVRIVCNASVCALAGDASTGRVRAVVCEDGEWAADVVLVGVGLVAADELASGAGLQCSNGIVVDEHCRTSDPSVFAAGDCTNHPNRHYGRQVRLESVDNAFEQGTSAALNMLGMATVHDKVPWFWSDQYDVNLVIIGLSQEHDEVLIRGDPASRRFSACYLRDGELIAVDAINSPKDQLAARKLVAARARPNRGKIVDPAIQLRDTV